MDDEISDPTNRPLSLFPDVTLAAASCLVALAVVGVVTWFLWLQFHVEAEHLFDFPFDRSEILWT